MAENTIDTLSIQITSSAGGIKSSVDTVIKHLDRLEGTLNGFSGKVANFGKTIDGLSGALSGLNSALGKVDANSLEKVAKSVSSLASASQRLNNAFGNTGMSKASQDAANLEAEMQKAVRSFMELNRVSPAVTKEMESCFSRMFKGATFKDGMLSDFSSDANRAFNDMGDVMRDNILKKSYDTIDSTTRKIVDYANNNKAKISLPFKLSDINIGNELAKSPRELLGNVFGVGNWTTTGKGNMNLKEYIEDFNYQTGSNLKADETQQAFMALAEAVIKAKESMHEFEASVMSVDDDMDVLWPDVENIISSLSRFQSTMATTSAEVSVNPFAKLAEGLQSLTTISGIPDLTGVAALATNIGKLANKQANAGIQNLPALVNGLQSLNAIQGITIPDLTGLAELISVISTLGTKKSGAATMNLQPLITGLQQLSAMTGMQFPDGTGLITLANAFSAFGRETTGRAVQNIPQLANAFNQMIVTLSKAPKVSSNVIALANAMAKLSSQGAKVGSASRSMNSALNRISASCNQVGARMRGLVSRVIEFGKNLLLSGKHANSAGRSYQSLVSKLGLLYAKYWALMRVVSIFGKVINPASSLIEVQNVVDTTFGNMAKKVEDFSHNAIKSFGLSELAAKQTASRYQAMGTAMGITGQQVQKAQQFLNMRKTLEGNVVGYDKMSNSMADMSINLTKLSADMASFYDVEQSTVEKALASGVLAGQSRPLNLAA